MLIRKLLGGLLAMFAFPTLSILMVALAGSAVFVVIASVLRTLGVHIAMNIALLEVPRLLSIPVGLLFGAFFFYLARQCWRLLQISYQTVKAAFIIK